MQMRMRSLILPVLGVWLSAGLLSAQNTRPSDNGAKAAAIDALPPEIREAAAKKYEALYGAEDKTISAHPIPRDEFRFAQKLAEAAKSLGGDNALRAVVLMRVAALGAKDPAGYGLACDALANLQVLDPINQLAYRAQFVDLLRQRVRRGVNNDDRVGAAKDLLQIDCEAADSLAGSHQYADALLWAKEGESLVQRFRLPSKENIHRKIERYQARRDAAVELERLIGQIESNPSDRSLQKRAIMLGVLAAEDPKSLLRISDQLQELDGHRMLPLAAQPMSESSEGSCKALAGWYSSLSQQSTGALRMAALISASRYCDRYLQLHDKEDADRLTVVEQALEIRKSMSNGSNGGHTADRIVIWNTHNGGFNDSGTKAIDIALLSHGRVIFERKGIALPWEKGKDTSLAIIPPNIIFDTVRVKVAAFIGLGGGIAEIQVFRNDENIALRGLAAASATIDNKAYVPEHVIDGNTSSADNGVGYWLLPVGKLGWVEVTLSDPYPEQ